MSRLPALCVVTGLVASLGGAPAAAAPVPAAELAQLQLRALNHRFIDARSDGAAALLQALTHPDFVYTRADGAWLSRADFIGHALRRPADAGASLADEPVRLFGPVALVHGLYRGGGGAGWRYTDVYLWSGSAWQLVSTQDTPLKDGVAVQRIDGQAPPSARWQGPPPLGDDLAQLTALNERYVQSFREADVSWYDAHLVDGYTVISSDGSYKNRGAALADFALPTFARVMESFPVDRVQVRRFADLALIHAANVFRLKDGRSGESRYTDIWVRQGGRWLCVAAHITAHRVPAAP